LDEDEDEEDEDDEDVEDEPPPPPPPPPVINMNQQERTFVMIKPDGVARGLVGEIMGRFERRGYRFIAFKLTCPSKDQLETHYHDLRNKPFFPSLLKYMQSGPVLAMVIEGLQAVKVVRTMLGETDPINSLPGSIRGDLTIDIGRNICHGSDSVENAKAEISLWFSPEELIKYNACPLQSLIYEHPCQPTA